MARRGGLTNRRLVIARLGDLEAATLLCDTIAPQMKRDSGYLRIEHAGYRRGDNAEMGTISFVDEISFEEKAAEPETKKTAKASESKQSESDVKEGK